MAPRLVIVNGPAHLEATDLVQRGEGFEEPNFVLERNVHTEFAFDIELNPGKRDEAIFYAKDGVTPILGGLIMRRSPIEVPAGAPYCARCRCSGYSIYGDWCYWTKSYDVDTTLKDVLTDLDTEKLSAYGLSLDAAQVTGPLLAAPFSWTRRRVSDVLKDLFDETGYVPKFAPDKTWKMALPGTTSAPADLDDDTLGTLGGDDSEEVPATKVIIDFGPSGTGDTPIVQLWTTDGVATSFALEGLNVPASDVNPASVNVDGTDYPVFPVGTGPADGIHWDPATADGTLSFDGSFASVVGTGGLTISLAYLPKFPFTIERDSGASPPIEKLLAYPTITDYAQASAIATQQLAVHHRDPRTFIGETLEDGFDTDQAVTVNSSLRDAASVSAIVTRVEGRMHTDEYWEYLISAEETDPEADAVIQADFVADMKRLIGQSVGGSVVLSGTTGGGGTPSVLSAPFPLGGSAESSQPAGQNAWADLLSPNEFYASADQSLIVRVWLWSRTNGTNVQARWFCITDNASAEDGAVFAGGAARPANPNEFAVVVEAGKRYKLQIRTHTAGVSPYGQGTLYSA